MSRLYIIAACIWIVAFAAAKAETCKIEKAATLPLTYLNGMAAVTAKINGTDVEMGVDTGSQTLITPEAASQFHLARDTSRRTKAIGTTAVTVVDNVLLRNLEFAGKRHGTLSVAKIALAVPPPSAANFGQASSKPLAGLIGGDLLSEYDVDFDLAGKSMTLYTVRGCTRVTPPWTEPYTPLSVKITPKHNVIIPVEIDGYKLTALLDTGASGFSITRHGALKSGVTEAMLKADPVQEISGVGGTNAKQPAHKFKTLIVGGETFRDIPLQLMPTQLRDGDVLIGHTYLIFRRVWISYSTRMIFVRAPKFPSSFRLPSAPSNLVKITPPADKPPLANPCLAAGSCGQDLPSSNRSQPFSEQDRAAFAQYVKKPEGFIGMETIALSPAANRALGLDLETALLVVAPIPDGPADKAGVRAGDIILSSNGQRIYAQASFMDMVKFKGEGFAMELAIKRQKQSLTITVPLAGPGEKNRLQMSVNPSARLERIIAEEEEITKQFYAQGFEIDSGLASVRLGNALRGRIEGDRAGNLSRAIAAYLDALARIPASTQAGDWAAAQHGLGAAYHARDAGRGGADLEQAIPPLELAYGVRASRGAKSELAATALELGLAHAERASSGAPESAERAIVYLSKAAEYYEANRSSEEYRMLNVALGQAHLLRQGQPRAARLENAIAAFDRALQAMDKGQAPDAFAKIEKDLLTLKAEKMRLAGDPAGADREGR